ncbi:trimeric intracellular cation channel family protein [Ornithinicoccus hortensis]|uniref:Putative membrane protein YeiH n=1 Tax=Ornithinicoccus hortensis TaxID=82346 RepID=A0A542YTQ6_9MICO|nr:trimeric intracellular cation channel family protein [Ornithinicoccus hortensis]TQL51469.1 putative membrane protein YeiH [Ornithinicoccus hortensis]
MVDVNPDLQLSLDLVGVFVFGLSGALVAVRRGLDLVGIVVLAWMAGLGGGMMRDVMIGAIPPVGISDWRLITAAALSALLVFALHGVLRDPDVPRRGLRRGLITRMVLVLDAVGLAAFAVTGSLKALQFGMPGLAAVIVGAISAVGGGLIRDLLAGQVPEVLRRELYAIPAVVGAVSVVLAHHLGYLDEWVLYGSAILVFVIRIVAVTLNLNAPQALRTGDH